MNKGIRSGQSAKREFLERISRMYYILEMNQKNIAEQLDIGRSSVARFLSEAKKEGVVRFHITSKTDSSRRTDLENDLICKYKLKDAVVIKEGSGSLFETTAVDYFNSVFPYQGSLGIGLGRTIHQVGQFLHMCEARPELKIIQMTGSVGKIEKELPATSVIQNWAQALEAVPHFLPAPALVETKEIKDFFLKDKNILESQREIRNIDVSVVGIGNTKPDSTILNENIIRGLTIEELQKHSVGDINLHFYDAQGNFSMEHISERVVGTTPLDLLRIPTRIGLAYGEDKTEAIKAALKGGLINILVTTDETAKLLI